MGTDLRRRLTNLERNQAPPGPWCACTGEISVVWDDGTPAGAMAKPGDEPQTERPPETCETCGKPIRVINIEWLDALEGE